MRDVQWKLSSITEGRMKPYSLKSSWTFTIRWLLTFIITSHTFKEEFMWLGGQPQTWPSKVSAFRYSLVQYSDSTFSKTRYMSFYTDLHSKFSTR